MNKIIETELGVIEYSILGSGKPILFLHGGHSNANETLFHKGYDPSKFKLITPSRPGYGKTPTGNFKKPLEAAKLIIYLLDQLKINKLIVVGISAGGLTAIELASNFSNRVEKLVLISAVTKKWLKPTDDFYIRGKKMFSPKREAFSWKMFRFFFRLFPNMMSKVLYRELSIKKFTKLTKGEVSEIKEMSFKQRSGYGFEIDLDQDIERNSIEKVKCPTLILHSKNDKSVSIEMAQFANEKIAKSKLITYDNKWGHLLWIGEESKKPIEDVMTFIEVN